MAPPNWVTSQQLEFLCSYIPIFVEHTAKETQSKFWPRLYEDWFNNWSELDVLIEDRHLPPEASSSDLGTPDDLDAGNLRYKLMKDERELYGAAIETCRKVSISLLRDGHSTHQHIYPLETAELDGQQ